MTEDNFIEMIVHAGLVVTDDERNYYIRWQYDSPSSLVSLTRGYVERATDDDIAQILALHVPGLDKYQTIGSSNKGCIHAVISAYIGLIRFLFHKRQ